MLPPPLEISSHYLRGQACHISSPQHGGQVQQPVLHPHSEGLKHALSAQQREAGAPPAAAEEGNAQGTPVSGGDANHRDPLPPLRPAQPDGDPRDRVVLPEAVIGRGSRVWDQGLGSGSWHHHPPVESVWRVDALYFGLGSLVVNGAPLLRGIPVAGL
jgi:hypothetical protein